MKTNLSYCGDLVRQHDRDRFLLSLTAPKSKRPALWALAAFNHEIARTREVVSEMQLGHIRLQWWRDAIAGIYAGKILRHDIVEALAAAINENALPQEWFQSLIDAREYDLENKIPATFIELEKYADRTSTPLNRLTLKILGQEENDKAIRAVSVGYALTGLVRAVPFHAAQGRQYLPKGAQDAEAVIKLSDKYLGSTQMQGRFAKACVKLADQYNKRIRRLQYRLDDARLSRPPLQYIVLIALGRI